MKYLSLTLMTVLLSGCFAGAHDLSEPNKPQHWSSYENVSAGIVEASALKGWWKNFEDPALDELIALTLSDSPDRAIAAARILEARGLRRTARSSLFPQIGANGNIRREDPGFTGPDEFYDATFDASFEIDLFGKNRNATRAASAELRSLEAAYHDVSLTLIAEVTRAYIDVRTFEKQVAIAEKNLQIQEKTAELIRSQHRVGEAPRLNVDRAENLVNTTKSSIPEFKRLSDNARLSLSVLVGHLPAQIAPILTMKNDIPGADIDPVMLEPASVLNMRPDIRAARENLTASTRRAESAWAELFPTLTLSGFFGESKGGFSSATKVWNVALGAAVTLIDFGRIEGQIDAARAVEAQAYETYRRTILEAITEVETALVDYSRINEQRVSLQAAFNNADSALTLSQQIYREGEISFIDVLDAQRTLNTADSALINAEAAQSQSLVRLYKALGVY